MKKTQKLIENKIKINPIKELILPFVVSFLTVFLLIYISPNLFKNKKSEESASKDKIKELIELEKYLYVDPLALLKLIDSGDKKIILVDIRDSSSFKKAHITGAVNFSIDQIKKDISTLKNKQVIVYGDTASSVLSKEIALLLIEKRINIRLMSVGWNEFRHFKNLWVPESQWSEIDINKYIQTNE